MSHVKKKKSASERQAEGKVFTKGEDGSLASWDIQRIKWEVLRSDVSASRKATPDQKKKKKKKAIVHNGR